MPKRVLFIVPYPTEGASARLRVEQFLPYLKDAGIEYSLRPFYSQSFYKILYKPGNTLKKVALFLGASFRRFSDICVSPSYNVVFIHREVFPIGLPVMEWMLFILKSIFRNRIVFDFDDAIYLSPEGSSSILSVLKCPWKTDLIIRHSDMVIAGNELLKEHALKLNKNVTVIPTCIDTNLYKMTGQKPSSTELVIGWVGSHTTQVFLKDMEPVFMELLGEYPNLKIHIIGGQSGLIRHERVMIKEWSLAGEKDDIPAFDIGIMPMPDTNWTRGKCAFKAILYMSFGIPVVVSPVGVNKAIIKDVVNGYLAATGVEWKEKLSKLLSDDSLRRSMGDAGRTTVVKGYSVEANAGKFVEVIENRAHD
jgi:glycosyltransferase involved in cell wall biosynthesis